MNSHMDPPGGGRLGCVCVERVGLMIQTSFFIPPSSVLLATTHDGFLCSVTRISSGSGRELFFFSWLLDP